MDDAALLKVVGQGDDLALRTLFERHAPVLASRLRRTVSADAVEDVLQETFIAVWKGAKRYEGKGAVGAWLWGIARRQAVLWCRNHGHPEAELSFEQMADDDPAMEAVNRAELAQVLAALGPPGSEQRELARLAWEEERPLAEIADQLGVPQGTVKSRLHRIRQLVRRAFPRGGA